MITNAGRPENTAASTRGATPKTSLPVGSSLPLTAALVGANSTMPVASPLRNSSQLRARLPACVPASR